MLNITDTLATQFALSKKASGDLNRIHNITTSRSELMMMWLLEIEKNKDFEDQVVEWRARTTNNGFGDFVAFFSKRDVEVRRLNKMVTGRTAAAGHHSAANVKEINKRIDGRVNTKMANFAAAFETAIDASALEQRRHGLSGQQPRDGPQRSGQAHLQFFQHLRRHPCHPKTNSDHLEK